jgi:hypothetical protein
MKYNVLPAMALFLVLAAIVVMNSCSLIGLGIGAAIDSSKPDQVLIPGWVIQKVKPGTQIRVFLNSGDIVSGKFLKVERVQEEEYAERYANSRRQKQEEFLLPALGDDIAITLKSGVYSEREFLGFDYYYAPQRMEAEKESVPTVPISILVGVKGDTLRGRVPLILVKEILDSYQNVMEVKALEKLASQGQIPFLSAIAIQELDTKRLIALDMVYHIEYKNKKHAKWVGLGIGAAIDVTLIIIAAALASSDWGLGGGEASWGGDGAYSCPFVYSFDGESYVLDSEPYGGTIFKAAQRTDWDNLDHLKEVQGTYRLKITNELQETQYLDELKLLVVDHPRGTRVLSSFSGEFHVLSAPRMPTMAVDFRGFDARELVKSKDDQFWLGNPFGRNPQDRTEARDGLILEFDRPEGAQFVKLAFSVQNTVWASYLLKQFLELHGDQLGNWYDLLNSSAEACRAFQNAMIREGMLLIKLWDGEVWQTSDFIWAVGPILPKDQVVWLDIGDIPGEILRLRVESAVGFWMINTVQADFTPDLPMQIMELSPARAIDHSGRDLKELLFAIDGHHYEMSSIQDWAELIFKAPYPVEELERSFILKATGYYIIHTDNEGEPHRDLITKLLSEPGAYGQYTLRLLNGYVTSALSELEGHGVPSP